MLDNSTPTPAPVYDLPTVDEIGEVLETGSLEQRIAALQLLNVHIELLAQKIEELPDKPAGEISAETPAA